MRADRNLSQEQAAFATLLANQNGYERVFSSTATLTLTQSGLLSVLLERQRYHAMHLAWRHARREKMRVAFWSALGRLFHVRAIQTPTEDSAKPLIGTVPRHT